MPDPGTTPAHRPGVRFEELDGEAVVYDRVGKRAIYLNETATVVWKLCNGRRTVADISTLLSKEYPESAADIESDVSEAIDRMAAARVVTLARRSPKEAEKPFSA